MKTVSASDAKRQFGDVLLKAQQAPVRINKNGKPVAVVISASTFAEFETYRETLLQQAIDKGVADIQANRVSAGHDVMQRLRKRVRNADG